MTAGKRGMQESTAFCASAELGNHSGVPTPTFFQEPVYFTTFQLFQNGVGHMITELGELETLVYCTEFYSQMLYCKKTKL